MPIPSIPVELDGEQLEAIRPVMEKVAEAAHAGMPGMALAQIHGGRMRVFFVSREQAEAVQRAMNSPVGLTTADMPFP